MTEAVFRRFSICTGQQETNHERQIAFAYRNVEGGTPIIVTGVHVDTSLKKKKQGLHATLCGSTTELSAQFERRLCNASSPLSEQTDDIRMIPAYSVLHGSVSKPIQLIYMNSDIQEVANDLQMATGSCQMQRSSAVKVSGIVIKATQIDPATQCGALSVRSGLTHHSGYDHRFELLHLGGAAHDHVRIGAEQLGDHAGDTKSPQVILRHRHVLEADEERLCTVEHRVDECP
mmetsp:Transcript_47467/g.119557  ORF Transcript_47467/g.119557 Transcript_47467/m.119557 type:complete len:232 (+) Transcript_47467:1092-1787(+)